MKRVPERMCVACRTMRPKKELVRVVKSPEGEVSLDPIGKKPGRGAYICIDPACLKKAQKIRALERAFATGIDSATYAMLEERLREVVNTDG